MNGFSEQWLSDYQARRTQPVRPVEAAPSILAVSPPGYTISLALSAPPSVNHLFANVPGVGRVKSKDYKRWSKIAAKEATIGLVGKTMIMGAFKATIHIACAGDIDNYCKAAIDLCQLVGAIEEDKHMTELHVYRQSGPPGIWIVLEKIA